MRLSYVLVYIFLLSLVGFVLMGVDKWKAKRNRWRVPERTIFLIAGLGGAIGATLGMHAFHHKTRHWYFKFGLPALMMLQIALLAAFIYWDAFLRA